MCERFDVPDPVHLFCFFPKECYLAGIINKQTLHVYQAGKKQTSDLKKSCCNETFLLYNGIKSVFLALTFT